MLGLAEDQVSGFADSTALFGSLPEFDSMAVANFLTAIEERLGILIEDDDVDAEDFASFGSLWRSWSGCRAARGLLRRRAPRIPPPRGYFSASSAAMQPVPAAVTAWR